MAAELQQTVDRLKAKMMVVNDRFKLICTERDSALERIAALEKDLDAARLEIQRLGAEVEFLRIATTISPERKDVERTRSLLSELIRDIDKCIADLKE